VQSWELRFKKFADTLAHTAITRRGYYGQPGDVFLDGKPYHGDDSTN
jgi:hypothetical protein